MTEQSEAFPSSPSTSGLDVTLVDGSTFAVSAPNGDFAGGVHGLYMLDTRVLSGFVLSVDDHSVQGLSVLRDGPLTARFVGRIDPPDGPADATMTVIRERSVGLGMCETIELRNYATTAVEVTVAIETDSDFAGLFDVKGGHAVGNEHRTTVIGRTVRITHLHADPIWQTTISFEQPPDETSGQRSSWRVSIPPGGSWSTCLEVRFRLGETEFPLAHPCGTNIEHALHAVRLASWRSAVPTLVSDDPVLDEAVAQAHEDLGVLRIFDPVHVDRVVVAAGAPWYMTLFGRDSLLTAWMALLAGPELAIGVLRSLADLQGTDHNPRTEEEPGRILHEVRYDQNTMRTLGGRNAYYGSVDATPLFVMLVGELARWGVARDVIGSFLPHVDRALEWIAVHGDRDGDGYVEYESSSETGLRNQGWKDSFDGIRYRDGRVADPPLAMAEVQAYVYSAYRSRAELSEVFGSPGEAAHWSDKATDLKARFNRDFWIDELGWYAMALDADKGHVDALGSNVGHCLWTGIIDDERAPLVAARLASPDMASGFGLRTLAGSTAGFNPLSYHCGSIWPHDTAIAVAGLARYGQTEAAGALTRGCLDAAHHHGGRLPELFGGFDRADFPVPVRYPASCSPQAWAAAAPLLLLRSMLGLEPSAAEGLLRLRPALPAPLTCLTLDGVPIAGARVRIAVDDSGVHVDGLPAHLRWSAS